MVLEPIFEADFLPVSYGFRPKRRAHDAVAEIHYYATRGTSGCSMLTSKDASTTSTTGHYSHGCGHGSRTKRPWHWYVRSSRPECSMNSAVRTTPMPERLRRDHLTAAGQYRVVRVGRGGDGSVAARGTKPRSGPSQTVRHGMGNWRIVRYADDFVIMSNGSRDDVVALREQVAEVLGGWACGYLRPRPVSRTLSRDRLPRLPPPVEATSGRRQVVLHDLHRR